jgi:hypothetical protein
VRKKHRWAQPKLRFSRIRPVPPLNPRSFTRTSHCIYCGATTRSQRLIDQVYQRWFARWGDIMRPIKHVPPCELPTNYEAPVGA